MGTDTLCGAGALGCLRDRKGPQALAQGCGNPPPQRRPFPSEGLGPGQKLKCRCCSFLSQQLVTKHVTEKLVVHSLGHYKSPWVHIGRQKGGCLAGLFVVVPGRVPPWAIGEVLSRTAGPVLLPPVPRAQAAAL